MTELCKDVYIDFLVSMARLYVDGRGVKKVDLRPMGESNLKHKLSAVHWEIDAFLLRWWNV
jgi:hypothetical protein